MAQAKIMKISEIIISWYKKNERDLPWRRTSDPYLIWLSEIILQQTRVNQGKSYYEKFAKRFPDVESLAEADEEEVLLLWQGLGYYSRARNMHYAARQIMTEFGGKFPADYVSLLRLKGVGSYTAAAIASIALGEAASVVDGNVSRVISRLYAIHEPVNSTKGGRMIQELADELLDAHDPGTHNQAVMEFGALQCIPVNPDCEVCPAKIQCHAYANGQVKDLPVKLKKAQVKSRYFYYSVIEQNGYTYINKRTGNDIWKSLFEFPMVETGRELEAKEVVKKAVEMVAVKVKMEAKHNDGVNQESIRVTKVSQLVKHVLSHRYIFARFVHMELPAELKVHGAWLKVKSEDLEHYPLPRLIDRYLSAK